LEPTEVETAYFCTLLSEERLDDVDREYFKNAAELLTFNIACMTKAEDMMIEIVF